MTPFHCLIDFELPGFTPYLLFEALFSLRLLLYHNYGYLSRGLLKFFGLFIFEGGKRGNSGGAGRVQIPPG